MSAWWGLVCVLFCETASLNVIVKLQRAQRSHHYKGYWCIMQSDRLESLCLEAHLYILSCFYSRYTVMLSLSVYISTLHLFLSDSVSLSSPQGPLAYHHQRAGWLARGWHRGAPFPWRAAESGRWGAQLCDRGEREALPAYLPGKRFTQSPQQWDHNVKTTATPLRASCTKSILARRLACNGAGTVLENNSSWFNSASAWGNIKPGLGLLDDRK